MFIHSGKKNRSKWLKTSQERKKKKMYRLYGNIKNLKKTGSNSMCDYYHLTLYLHIDGEWYPITKEKGFSFYSKKEIYKILKNDIINDLSKQGIETH